LRESPQPHVAVTDQQEKPMNTQPLETAIATTRSVLANVKPDQLAGPTPCQSWDVAALINHIVGAHRFFVAGMTGQPPAGGGDATDGDFLAAYDEATQAFLACFDDPAAMTKTIKMPFGEMPGAAVMGLGATDTFQHGWDLAKATGQSTDLAPELAAGLLAQSRQAIQPAFRGDEGAPFGPEQTAPDGASAADQLAAFLGRKV
jgi:uncharacterized protein (TIGR03086 family)